MAKTIQRFNRTGSTQSSWSGAGSGGNSVFAADGCELDFPTDGRGRRAADDGGLILLWGRTFSRHRRNTQRLPSPWRKNRNKKIFKKNGQTKHGEKKHCSLSVFRSQCRRSKGMRRQGVLQMNVLTEIQQQRDTEHENIK